MQARNTPTQAHTHTHAQHYKASPKDKTKNFPYYKQKF